MTKRLQVVFEDAELREIQRVARREKTTVSAWVRQALRAARAHQPAGDVDRKLAALRAAARHSFPTGEIEQVLAEIERGYVSDVRG